MYAKFLQNRIYGLVTQMSTATLPGMSPSDEVSLVFTILRVSMVLTLPTAVRMIETSLRSIVTEKESITLDVRIATHKLMAQTDRNQGHAWILVEAWMGMTACWSVQGMAYYFDKWVSPRANYIVQSSCSSACMPSTTKPARLPPYYW